MKKAVCLRIILKLNVSNCLHISKPSELDRRENQQQIDCCCQQLYVQVEAGDNWCLPGVCLGITALEHIYQ